MYTGVVFMSIVCFFGSPIFTACVWMSTQLNISLICVLQASGITGLMQGYILTGALEHNNLLGPGLQWPTTSPLLIISSNTEEVEKLS